MLWMIAVHKVASELSAPTFQRKLEAATTSTHKSTKCCGILWLKGARVECTCQVRRKGRWFKPKLTLIQAATCTKRELGHFLLDLCMCLHLCVVNWFAAKIFIQILKSKTGTNSFLDPFSKQWMNLLVWFAQHDDSFFECEQWGNGIWNWRERVSFTPIVLTHVATGNELEVGEAVKARPPHSMKNSRFTLNWREGWVGFAKQFQRKQTSRTRQLHESEQGIFKRNKVISSSLTFSKAIPLKFANKNADLTT